MSFAKIIIIGNLGENPELRHTKDEIAVVNFSVATNERVGDKDKTTWFRVTAWRKQAEAIANNLKKGSLVYVDGSLSMETYQTQGGESRTSLTVQASNVRFLGGKQEAEEVQTELDVDYDHESQQPEKKKKGKKSDDDIPF